jgi:hypothetical protein
VAGQLAVGIVQGAMKGWMFGDESIEQVAHGGALCDRPFQDDARSALPIKGAAQPGQYFQPDGVHCSALRWQMRVDSR